MKLRRSEFQADLLIHLFFLLIQILLLLPNGLGQSGSTPAFVFPFFMLLSAITVFRIYENQADFGSKLVFIPALFSIYVVGFCLINELGGDFWAFIVVRQFPVWLRTIWYQSILLLLHPKMFSCVWNGASSLHREMERRGYYGKKMLCLFFIASMILWLVRSQNITPDGYDWMKHSAIPRNWANYLREPLGTLLFRLAAWGGMKWLHWDSYISITVLTILCGCAAVWFMSQVILRIVPKSYAGVVMALLIGSCGFSQVFAGNIEIYALLQVGLAAYLFFTVRYLEGRCPAWGAGLSFGILFCIHLSSAWWLPAFLMLPVLKSLRRGSWERLYEDAAWLIFGFFFFTIVFWLFVLFHRYEGQAVWMFQHFWSDQVIFCGADGAMFHPLSVYFRADYYLEMFNEYFYLMPGMLPLGIVFLGAWRSWGRMEPAMIWLIFMTGGYLIYSAAWHADRPLTIDWDIFSGLTIPAGLTMTALITRLTLARRTIEYILYQSAVLSLLYLTIQLLRNHAKITDWPML
ncbi:MAG: hypothetical protein AB1656_15485 [Candidatus Omnitrophota bacterium]